MNLIEYDAKQYNDMATNDVRRGTDTALTTYDIVEQAKNNYKLKQDNDKDKNVEEITLGILDGIKKDVQGRPTMGEVEESPDLYMEDR